MPRVKRQSFRERSRAQRADIHRRRQTSHDSDTDREEGDFENRLTLKPNEVKAGKVFDELCSCLKFKTCYHCNRRSPELKLPTPGMCSKCQEPIHRFKFSRENNMDPGPVPPELSGLTHIEQILIAQVHPIISMYRIRGAQYVYSGQVIHFYQNINEYIRVLPVNPADLPSTLVFNKNTSSGHVTFRARAEKIRAALLWLKTHNMYYSSIEISEYNLSRLPEDGDISHLIPSVDFTEELEGDVEGIEESFVLPQQNFDQQQYIEDELHLEYPTRDECPINEFTTEGYIACAVPCLFPTGDGDLRQNRHIPVTEDDYFKHLMKYRDPRFSQDSRFRYFALNTVMRHNALATANVYVQRSRFRGVSAA